MNKDEMIKRFKAVTPEIDAILNNPKSKEKVNALHHPEHASALQDLYKVIDQITAKPYVEITENESYMLELAISFHSLLWILFILMMALYIKNAVLLVMIHCIMIVIMIRKHILVISLSILE